MRMKLSPIPSVIQGKRVVLIDDSIVRGTTNRQLVSLFKRGRRKRDPSKNLCTSVSASVLLWYRHRFGRKSYCIPPWRKRGRHAHRGGFTRYLPLECLHELTGTHSYCDACFSGNTRLKFPQMSERTDLNKNYPRGETNGKME